VRAWEVQNMLLTAWLTARSAQWRCESRGCHWREEFKGPKDELRAHDCWKRGRSEPVLKRIVGGGG
jgi:succinate dehydrogenase/fumarate reductase flavoprotein subunit